MDKFERARMRMVKTQLRGRGLKDARTLDCFENVPRHLFVPKQYQRVAYDDNPLPIGYSQTISQPYMVALMTELLTLKGNERILEVGTGSGYQAAILGHLAAEVHTVEFIPELASRAQELLKELGLENIHVHQGDGSVGWSESAPYDGILVTAAAPKTPKILLDQLEDGGRLVLPVGGRGMQSLEVWDKQGDEFRSEVVTAVSFVPLRGEKGWNHKKW